MHVCVHVHGCACGQAYMWLCVHVGVHVGVGVHGEGAEGLSTSAPLWRVLWTTHANTTYHRAQYREG